MTDDQRIVELFEDFANRWNRGDEPDVSVYLERAGGRAVALAAAIDLFVETTAAPPATEAAEVIAAGLGRGEAPLRALEGVLVEAVAKAGAFIGFDTVGHQMAQSVAEATQMAKLP